MAAAGSAAQEAHKATAANSSRADLPAADVPRSVFATLDDLAHSAAKGGPLEIDAFVEGCLAYSLAYSVGSSVRSRITKVELAYRARTQRAITDADLANAINRAAARYWAPSFVLTNHAQLLLLRERLDTVVPHLGDLTGGTAQGRKSRGISPAHATFILTFLATQKLANGAYQMEADAWVQETRRHIKAVEEARAPVRQQPHPQVWALPLSIRAVMSEPPSNTNMFTVAMHRVLDDLGLAR